MMDTMHDLKYTSTQITEEGRKLNTRRLKESLKQKPNTASPFLKWAGGKTQLLSQLEPLLPPTFKTYFEPFLGGGAVFFYLLPHRAVTSDINRELINVYLVVRDSVEELIRHLRRHVNEKDYYYQVREQDPQQLSPVERASRLIFLNKTCFNGLYRVNQKGKFNVPFGRYTNPTICDAENLRAVHAVLQEAEILAVDFETILQRAREGDFVYLDPPFHPLSTTSSFTSYAVDGFNQDAQRRLARVLRELDARGCFWLLSNSDTPFINELYRDFYIARLDARRAINSKGDRRGPIAELAIRNYS